MNIIERTVQLTRYWGYFSKVGISSFNNLIWLLVGLFILKVYTGELIFNIHIFSIASIGLFIYNAFQFKYILNK